MSNNLGDFTRIQSKDGFSFIVDSKILPKGFPI